MIEVDSLVGLVSSVGFPIAMCFWFMWRIERVINNNTKALDQFIDDYINEHRRRL